MTEEGGLASRAAELFFTAMAQRSEARLRRLAPRPFGFAPGTPQPAPAMIGSEVEEVTEAAITGEVLADSPIPLSSMSLTYGDAHDPAATFIEITTDFTPGHEDSTSLEYVLGEADNTDAALARGDPGAGRPLLEEPAGPFSHATAEIIVEGEPRTVATLTYRRHHAFRFQQDHVLVTVVSRNQLPDRPALAPVTDLEPYLQQTTTARQAEFNRLPKGPPGHRGP
jgi:hypothetical protein